MVKIKKKRITSSNFGSIIKMRESTNRKPTVLRLIK